jgi:CheY-like chemotaxis protein
MSKRILVVDDEDHIREVAQVSLETVAGWQVIEAASGEEAVAKAWSEQPDAILLDVMMPEMDGPTTVDKLRSNEATRFIPIILLTAKVQAADRRTFDGLDISGVIAKPFNPMTLASEVSRTLDWDP